MAAKEYQLQNPITLSQAAAVRLGALNVDFRGSVFSLFIDVLKADGTVAESKIIELTMDRLDQFITLVASGALSQSSFEEAMLLGAVLFDSFIPNNGTIVDL